MQTKSPPEQIIPKAPPHMQQGQGFGPPNNNIALALQAHAWAQVQSRYVMAFSRPRDVAECRQKLLTECKQYRFAAEAVWSKPQGKQILRGLGIRFAEAAMQAWRNLTCETTIVCEDKDNRTLRTTVTDLEINTIYSSDSIIEKFVLRKHPPKLPNGQTPTVHAYNNYGEPQYKVRATEDELIAKQNSAISKVRRNLILAHIPRWILDDCKVELHRTNQQKASRGDRRFLNNLIDEFAEHKVSVQQLKIYVGQDIATITGYQANQLSSLLYDLKENRITWKAAVHARLNDQRREASEAERADEGDSQVPVARQPRRRQQRTCEPPRAETEPDDMGEGYPESDEPRVDDDPVLHNLEGPHEIGEPEIYEDPPEPPPAASMSRTQRLARHLNAVPTRRGR